MCTMSRWNVTKQKQKQSTKIKTGVVVAMVMEDKSMVVCGREYSGHKSIFLVLVFLEGLR